jgi:hypothetical protein
MYYVYAGQASVCPKYSYYAQARAGFNYEKFYYGLIPCPSGIAESRYPPNTGYEYGLCGQGDVGTNRMARARASQPKLFSRQFLLHVKIVCGRSVK